MENYYRQFCLTVEFSNPQIFSIWQCLQSSMQMIGTSSKGLLETFGEVAKNPSKNIGKRIEKNLEEVPTKPSYLPF